MSDVQQNVYGQYIERSVWRLPNGNYTPLLKSFVDAYVLHPTEVQPVINALGIQNDMNNLTQYVGLVNNSNSAHPFAPYNLTLGPAQGHHSANVQFSVGQLAINTLQIAKDQLHHRMYVSKMSFAYVEHRTLGWTIFNDTNHNGIMDLGMREIPSATHNATYVPTIGNESLYRVAFDSVQSIAYTVPTIANNILSFGFTASNVNVTLFTIIRNTDATAYSDQFSVSNQTISQISTTFHFSINSTSNSAQTKFDFYVGNWSNQLMLKGLSLNTMYGMIYENFNATSRTMRLNGNNTGNFGANNNSAHFRSIHFYVGSKTPTPIASVSLDNVPYTWGFNDSSQQAYGQSLPLLYGFMIFGAVTYNSQAFHAMIGQAASAAYLYSISYPAFGGYSINHDPTYSMVASAVPPTSNSTSQPLPGFGILLFVVAVPFLVLINKKVHKKE